MLVFLWTLGVFCSVVGVVCAVMTGYFFALSNENFLGTVQGAFLGAFSSAFIFMELGAKGEKAKLFYVIPVGTRLSVRGKGLVTMNVPSQTQHTAYLAEFLRPSGQWDVRVLLAEHFDSPELRIRVANGDLPTNAELIQTQQGVTLLPQQPSLV